MNSFPRKRKNRSQTVLKAVLVDLILAMLYEIDFLTQART